MIVVRRTTKPDRSVTDEDFSVNRHLALYEKLLQLLPNTAKSIYLTHYLFPTIFLLTLSPTWTKAMANHLCPSLEAP